MKKKSSPKRNTSMDKRLRVRKNEMPVDVYEAWLKGQNVKRVPSKPEVHVPMDSYEAWMQNQVQKRMKLRK